VFDVAFLRAEFHRAGWQLPPVPAFCTLKASWFYLPDLEHRRLGQCCHAADITHSTHHRAIDDARATAALLRWYLDPRTPPPPHAEHLTLTDQAASIEWPTSATHSNDTASGPVIIVAPRRRGARVTLSPTLIASLASHPLQHAVEQGAPPASVAYLQLLREVLEDGVITVDEGIALAELADHYELTANDVHLAHHGFLAALAQQAVADDHVTHQERDELRAIATLLDLPPDTVPGLLRSARDQRITRLGDALAPLPDDWTLGEPLRVGDRVAVTGCASYGRAALEQLAARNGITITGSVSKTTALLVSDGTINGTKANAARQHGTRTVTPTQFEQLVAHTQPALPRPTTPHPKRSQPPRQQPDSDSTPVDPAAIREWARDQGIDVGTRGRLNQALIDAYNQAHPPHHA
jgi:DNA polymerase-3 subunit epsilon